MEHHLYSLSPLTSLSVDTLGPLKFDKNGNSFIIVIVDNFSTVETYWTLSGQEYDLEGLSWCIIAMGINIWGT